MLLHLLGRHVHVDAGLGRQLGQPAQRHRSGLWVAAGEDRDRARRVHGSALRAAASRSSTAPARPRLGRARRSSRGCRPGRAGPTTRIPAPTRPASRAACATPTSAPRRASGSRTTPPLPTCPRPTSNCGLTSARQSNSGAAQASTAGSTLASEMKETSATTRSGREGQQRRVQGAGVHALDHRDPRVLAQPPVELAVGHVQRDHGLRAALEQAVGEAARRGAHVQAPPPGRIDARRRRARWPA